MKRQTNIVPTIANLIQRRPANSLLWPLELTETKYLYGKCDRHVLCQCTCGKLKLIPVRRFLSEAISCGHVKEALDKKMGGKFSIYPKYIRSVFHGIKARCYNKKDPSYKKYGAKGVRVCKEWLKKPELFYKWALDNGWERGMHIDKDIRGNSLLYSPDTCMVATPKQNYDARRNLIRYEFRGKKLTVSEIARETGLKLTTVYRRLKIAKWTPEDSVTIPLMKNQYERTGS